MAAAGGTDFDPEAPLPGPPAPWQSSAMPVQRAGPPWLMTDMIAAEPALAGRLLRRLGDDAAVGRLAANLVAAAIAGDPIRVVGCGTSEHGAQGSALILAWALRERLGRDVPVEAAQAFEAALAPQNGGLVIGVSHEGGTWATNEALAAARGAGSRTVLLTAGDGSPGAALADLVVATGEMDQSWCHTIGYLSPLLAATATAAHVTGRPLDAGAVRGALARGTADPAAAEAVAARLADAEHLLVIASGADRPAARELALKIEEATWLPTTMRDLETFLHGHLPANGSDSGLVLLLTDERGLSARTARAIQALAAADAVGIRVAAILSAAADAALADAPTPTGRMLATAPAGLEGPAAALLASVTPLQLLTERLARARGTNPDLIRRGEPAYLEAAARAG
ncbi:MAG: SIS domain-containing protein [Candidatus Limnocylindrales bacterium]